MTTIFAKTNDGELLAVILPKIPSNGKNSVRLHVDFDSEWDGYTKSAVFYTEHDPTPYEEILSSEGNCLIRPPELLAMTGKLYISVKGIKGSTEKTSTELTVKVLSGTPTLIVADPSPNMYQKLLTAYGDAEKEIAVERARINNLAKMAEGSTTGDAELSDIRIDVYGNTHGTAGDAVRTQIMRVEDETTNFERGIADFLNYGKTANCGWKIGEIETQEGKEGENPARIRSEFLYAPKGTHLIFNGDLSTFAGMFVFVYNVDKTYRSTTGAYELEYIASDNCFVRLVTKYNDEREISKAELPENLVDVYFPETKKRNKTETMNDWYAGGLTVENGGCTDENALARVKSRFIRLTPNERVVFGNLTGAFAGIYVFVYDKEKNYISHSGKYLTEYIAGEDCYIRLVTKYNDERVVESVGEFNNLVIIEYNRESKSYIVGDFAKYFECGELEGMTDTLSSTTINYIYGRYDTLMNEHPETVSRKTLGYATTESGEQDTAFPIYEYEINADDSERPIEDVPVILVQSGIHGNEKSSVYGTLLFFENLFEGADSVLLDIKSGFNFKVIPILNPYGYDNNVRTNARGVDINRNFGYLWGENDSEQKGDSSYSELETQILRDWLAENKDALMYIDYHNMGDYNPYISYINTPCAEIQKVYSNFIRRATNRWRGRYHKDRKGSVYGWLNNDKIPCTYNEAYYNAGIYYSCTLEIAWDESGAMYTKRVIETSFEQLVNFIASMLDYIHRGNDEHPRFVI